MASTTPVGVPQRGNSSQALRACWSLTQWAFHECFSLPFSQVAAVSRILSSESHTCGACVPAATFPGTALWLGHGAEYRTATVWEASHGAEYRTATVWEASHVAEYHTATVWEASHVAEYHTATVWEASHVAEYRTATVWEASHVAEYRTATVWEASHGAEYHSYSMGGQPCG